MKTNRLLTRRQASGLALDARVAIETQITDALADTARIPQVPAGWTLDDYIRRSPWRRYLFGFLGPIRGKVILDLGCGYHPTPLFFALAGARRVVACDVSPKAIAYVERVAAEFGVADRIDTLVSPAEHLPCDSDMFDLIHGEAVLHHLHLEDAGRELERILKPGGRAGFKDPLGQNPFLEFARDYVHYGWKHPAKGTDRPLTYAAIERFGQHFQQCTYRGFGVASALAIALTANRNTRLRGVADCVDRPLLSALPVLQRLGRFVVTCVVAYDSHRRRAHLASR